MKLQRNLVINQKEWLVIDTDIRLQLATPGRASFTIQGTPPKKGAVRFSIGYSRFKTHPFFTGFIERVTPIDDKHSTLFCRELSALLAHDIPLSLRRVSLRNILDEVTNAIGLEFITPDKDYVNTPVSDFINLGSGYLLMNALAEVFQIRDFFWQQRFDGKVFVGSYNDSHWSKRQLDIPIKQFTQQRSNNSAELAPIPAIRPGAIINGNQVQSVQLENNVMRLQWKTR